MKMDRLALGSFCFFTLVFLCFAEDVTEEELLKTLLSNPSENKLGDIMNELLLEKEKVKLENLLDSEERSDQIDKRVFCNGFFGCTNGKRRRQGNMEPEDNQQVAKRPFCNGFFGCGNGKRSFQSPTVPVEPPKAERKRLFCNVTGCGNFGKRSLYSRLIARLQNVPEEN